MCISTDAMIVRKGSQHNFDKKSYKRITIAEKSALYMCAATIKHTKEKLRKLIS